MSGKFLFFILKPSSYIFHFLFNFFEEAMRGRVKDYSLSNFMYFGIILKKHHNYLANLVIKQSLGLVIKRYYFIYFLDDEVILHIHK